MICRPAAAALVAFVLPTAAQADWQFTKWGMSPSEVARAAGPSITNVPDGGTPGVWPAPQALLQMPYASEKFNFLAQFVFSQDHGLSEVRLILLDGDPDELRRNLAVKYGAGGITYPLLSQLGNSWATATDDVDLLMDPTPEHTIVPWGAHAVITYKKRGDVGL